MAGYVAVAAYAASSCVLIEKGRLRRYSLRNNRFLLSGDGMQRSSLKLLWWSPGPTSRPRASWSSAAVLVQKSLLLGVSGTYLPRGPQIIFIVNPVTSYLANAVYTQYCHSTLSFMDSQCKSTATLLGYVTGCLRFVSIFSTSFP